MIKFFYGEDEYSVQLAARKVIASFVDSEKTDLNVNFIEGSELSMEKITDALLSMPFLGDKKLTVIRNFILENTKESLEKNLIKILDDLPESSDVIFTETGKMAIKNPVYKYLEKNSEKKYFSAMSPVAAIKFIQEKAAAENIKISSAVASKLSFFVGSDSWRLSNEINKLANFAKSEQRDEISSEDVESMVEANVNLKIFDLTDALADRNTKKTLGLFGDFMKAGEDVVKILSMVVYQIRNMLIVEDLILAKSHETITKASGLHPFVAQKTERAVRKIRPGKLTHLYQQLEDIDWSLKTGQKEIVPLLTMSFVDFCESDKMTRE